MPKDKKKYLETDLSRRLRNVLNQLPFDFVNSFLFSIFTELSEKTVDDYKNNIFSLENECSTGEGKDRIDISIDFGEINGISFELKKKKENSDQIEKYRNSSNLEKHIIVSIAQHHNKIGRAHV